MFKKLKQKIRQQKGAFSPFMFGMLAGLAIFSGVLRSEYINELGSLESLRQQRLEREAKAMADAVENYLRSEITTSYDYTGVDVNDVQQLLSTSGATTDAGQVFAINIIDYDINFTDVTSGSPMPGTRQSQVFLMSPADSSMIRNQIAAVTTKEDALDLAATNKIIVAVDTESVRQEQVAASKERLEQIAALLYDYYTRGFVNATSGRLHSFPRSSLEFTLMLSQFSLQQIAKDYWGRTFTYKVDSTGNFTDTASGTILSQRAVISFLTPWGELYPITLSVQ